MTLTERPDAYEKFVALCEDEIGLLEDGARHDIADVLESADQLNHNPRTSHFSSICCART